jgi:hypothetical protein
LPDQQQYRSPFFSQSQGRKHPMISHSAVAKKQRRFNHFGRHVRIDLTIIPDNALYFSIPAAWVCRHFGLV